MESLSCKPSHSLKQSLIIITYICSHTLSHALTSDALLPHGECRHAVCDECGGKALGHGFVRRQPGALVIRPRLCTVHPLQTAQSVQGPHHPYTHSNINIASVRPVLPYCHQHNFSTFIVLLKFYFSSELVWDIGTIPTRSCVLHCPPWSRTQRVDHMIRGRVPSV